jgi:peptidoglycan/LPS O-acetylase OafA/YrhL
MDAGAAVAAEGAPGDSGAVSAATAMPYYDFHSPNPKGGFCEQQMFGRGRMLAEPINVAFSIPTLILGLVGLFRSKRTAMAFQFLYGLLASYGLFAALYHATLQNGFYRMQDVAVSMVQSFVIILLVHALYLYRVKRHGRDGSHAYRIVAVLTTLFFTAYPAAVHVAGESSANPWVAWLVFDLLWTLVGGLLLLIWRRRATWPSALKGREAFGLVAYAMASAVVAYGGWSLDRFACCPTVAMLCLHGWWDLAMGLCFYYLISLARFLSAHEYGFEPVVERIPIAGPLHLPFVEWKSRSSDSR